jgi:hypothetical protein
MAEAEIPLRKRWVTSTAAAKPSPMITTSFMFNIV